MKRSYPLRVDRLEDRCVPATDLVTNAVPALIPPPSVDTSYVIDPYLIDPNSAPPPVKSDPGLTPPDQSTVPPIGDPFWY